MNLEVCRKIGDLLMNNKPSNLGLTNGTAGISIFLYCLSRNLSDDSYAEYADSLLEDIYENVAFIKDSTADMIGMGWCFEYLIQNKFCDGNADEILEQIDNRVYRIMSEEDRRRSLDLTHGGLVGYLHYLIIRLKNKEDTNNSEEINVELFKLTINLISQEALDHFMNLAKDINFSLWDNLYILLLGITDAYSLNIYNEKILNMLRQWESHWTSYIPGIHFNRLYLALNLYRINRILKSRKTNEYIKTLLFSLDINSLRSEVNVERCQSINTGYLGLIFVLKKSISILDPSYPNYTLLRPLMNEISDLCNSHLLLELDKISEGNCRMGDYDLGIVNGWAGVGLFLLQNPEIMENCNTYKFTT